VVGAYRAPHFDFEDGHVAAMGRDKMAHIQQKE
jgi:hypothetical protein